jgi:hypothetical protein
MHSFYMQNLLSLCAAVHTSRWGLRGGRWMRVSLFLFLLTTPSPGFSHGYHPPLYFSEQGNERVHITELETNHDVLTLRALFLDGEFLFRLPPSFFLFLLAAAAGFGVHERFALFRSLSILLILQIMHAPQSKNPFHFYEGFLLRSRSAAAQHVSGTLTHPYQLQSLRPEQS